MNKTSMIVLQLAMVALGVLGYSYYQSTVIESLESQLSLCSTSQNITVK